MNEEIHNQVAGLLRGITHALCACLNHVLPTLGKGWWNDRVTGRLTDQQWRQVSERGITDLSGLDLAALLRVLDQNWFDIRNKLNWPQEIRNYLKETQSIRNRWAHAGTAAVPVDDIYRDLDTLRRFAQALRADGELVERIQTLKNEIIHPTTTGSVPVTPAKAPPAPKAAPKQPTTPPPAPPRQKKTKADRLGDLSRFYTLLTQLEQRLGGCRTLASCDGRMGWPERGIYFFFEPNETRSDSGDGPRIVRVGTHALTANSRTKLWGRLSQHRGVASTNGGNHRGSIFRLIVGRALVARHPDLAVDSWGKGSSAPKAVREREHALEQAVSQVIGAMPFLWLKVDDPPGPNSLRGLLEQNTIALLSNHQRTPLDPPSPDWLGLSSDKDRVRTSGLWNSRHVEQQHDGAFLDVLEQLIAQA